MQISRLKGDTGKNMNTENRPAIFTCLCFFWFNTFLLSILKCKYIYIAIISLLERKQCHIYMVKSNTAEQNKWSPVWPNNETGRGARVTSPHLDGSQQVLVSNPPGTYEVPSQVQGRHLKMTEVRAGSPIKIRGTS